MITAEGLEQLGFERHNDNGGDYRLMLKDGVVVITEWFSDKPKPNEVEIASAHAEWEAAYNATQYQRDRKEEYPSIEECVHAMLDDGLVELQEKRAAIKAKYPKVDIL
jgi:hypothetical protein